MYATSLAQAFKTVMICILLTLAEFAAVAVIVAPRAVARKLKDLTMRLVGHTMQALSPALQRDGAGSRHVKEHRA